nr:uroporphyrinogen-III synthase [Neobacillus sp. Marseille-Q6967]
MIESSRLMNKKVLVPRGAGQAKPFSKLVKEYGGIPVEIPLIAFRPIVTNPELEAAIGRLHTYDWIVFTSNVTIETFFSFFKGKSSFPKVAVIGKKTEEVLKEKGLQADFVPSAYVAEVFVEEFLPNISSGTKVLIPKGNLAREYISSSLIKNGALVDEIVIYETYMPDESREKLAKMLAEDELDILLFTSPSTVDHFMSVVKESKLESHLERCIVGCIGPVTKKNLKKYGFSVHASPNEYTVKEMIHSTIEYLEMG